MQTTKKDKESLKKWVEGYITAIMQMKFPSQGKTGMTWKFIKGVIDDETSVLPQKKNPTMWNELDQYGKIDLISKVLNSLARKSVIESFERKRVRYYRLKIKENGNHNKADTSNIMV